MKSVYLIRANDGKYKIGVSKNPQKRLNQLQTANSDELKLIKTYKSNIAQKLESVLHNRYAHGKERGEWFNLSIIDESRFCNTCENIEKTLYLLNNSDNEFIKL